MARHDFMGYSPWGYVMEYFMGYVMGFLTMGYTPEETWHFEIPMKNELKMMFFFMENSLNSTGDICHGISW